MPIQIDSLAQIYAKSVFELARQAGAERVTEVAEELEQIVELSRSNPSFREFLRSPIVDQDARQDAIRRIFGDKVTDLTLRSLLVLNAKGRLNHLEQITGAYDRLVHEAFGRIEVDVYTPEPLDDERREAIRQRIRDALGKEPVLYAYTDPAMIGGIKLQIGDQLVDASVQTRLQRLRDHLLRGGSRALRSRIEQLITGDGSLPN